MILEKLLKKHKDYSQEIIAIRKWLGEADAIVVGIGGGLSASGGIDYDKSRLVKDYFSDYFRMGYRKISELEEMYADISSQNAKAYWGFWARYIREINYNTDVGNGYKDLLRLLRHKNYFIYTTNIDGQVQKTGFDEARVFAYRGDIRYLKCSKPCCHKAYESKDLLDGMIKSMHGNLEITPNKVPRCQYCGEYLIPDKDIARHNIDVKLSEDERDYGDREAVEAYRGFIESNKQGKMVFLELGAGTKRPELIRTPFENMTKEYENAKLIRINKKEARIPEELIQKAISIEADLEEILGEMASGIVSM